MLIAVVHISIKDFLAFDDEKQYSIAAWTTSAFFLFSFATGYVLIEKLAPKSADTDLSTYVLMIGCFSFVRKYSHLDFSSNALSIVHNV